MPLLYKLGQIWAFQGERDASFIISLNDGFLYHKHHDKPGTMIVSLRCTKWRKRNICCRGRAAVSRDGQHVRITHQHTSHVADPYCLEEKVLRANVLSRTMAGDTTPFFQIVREEGQRGRFSMEARSRITVARIRTSLRNARMKNLPCVPRNLATLGYILSSPQYQHITQTYDKTDSIFAGYCGRFAEGTLSLVFASRRMRNILQTARKVFADGTFKKRPKKPASSQIFNISITWKNRATNTKHVITIVRVFMQTRTEAAYNVLFAFLKHLMPNWEPDQIMCDNERAQVNAWITAFPNAWISTCLWHYAVDVFTYAKSLTMHNLMQNSWVADSIVRCCCAIPLLPRHLLMQGLLTVGHWARQTGYMQFACMRNFFSYLNREWMPREAHLSVCGCEDRTNNVSECTNFLLGWECRKNYPNVYEVTGAFVKQEDQFCVDIHALSDGRDASRAQRVTCLANDARIQNLTDSLIQQRVGLLQFLISVSKNMQAPYDYVFRL